jgi:outer membrane protein OmpA-like peptidoglycan-associated protein
VNLELGSTPVRLGRRVVIASLIAATLSPSAQAQVGRGGQVELGAFGSLTGYDSKNIGFSSEFGAGSWLGFYLSRLLSLEGTADYTVTTIAATGQDLRVARLAALLVAHTRTTPIGSVYLGVGLQQQLYRGAIDARDGGALVVLGDRLSLGGRSAIRLEGRLDYLPGSDASPTNSAGLNLGGALGLSIFAFGGPPRDDDGDTVANKQDRCPDTPRGAVVDADGCPVDSDGDLVFDGFDTCPDTPRGAIVDAQGCPADADGDGVVNGPDACPDTPLGATVDAVGCPADGDLDGVLDGLDQCPDTPTGARVDAAGCPIDGDQDSVFDGIDQCPGTPAGTPVDARGCPLDSDGDGVHDGADQCPATPEGTQVDAVGCPLQLDTDGDGVPNDRDRCPNTAPGQSVDAVGCPSLFVIEEGRARPLVLRGVRFETGRSALRPESFATLDEVAASLLANPNVRIEIAGHTDNTGSRALNQRLSLQRAQAVKAYLASKGVRPDRMEARGYGPDRPIVPNDTPAGREQNRRVELNLLEGPTN